MANTHRGEVDVKFDEHTLTLCATFDNISKIEDIAGMGAIRFMREMIEGGIKIQTVRDCLRAISVSGDVDSVVKKFDFKYLSIAQAGLIRAFGQAFESDGEGKDSEGE